MADAKNLNFLVVDDMKTMRMIVRSCLKPLGVESIHEADDGDTAWEVLQNNSDIDVIVSDWNMPRMTGVELLKKCRNNDSWKDVAFLMVTAEQEITQVKEAIQEGVDGYVVKPFNPTSFKERLDLVLKKRFNS